MENGTILESSKFLQSSYSKSYFLGSGNPNIPESKLGLIGNYRGSGWLESPDAL